MADSTAQSLDSVSFQSTGWGFSIFSRRRASSSFLSSYGEKHMLTQCTQQDREETR